ncbi:hypothetical protein BN1723_003779, partial [Verticillium longisporum]
RSQCRAVPSTCHGISQVRQVVGGGTVEIEAALEQDQIRKDFADRVTSNSYEGFAAAQVSGSWGDKTIRPAN